MQPMQQNDDTRKDELIVIVNTSTRVSWGLDARTKNRTVVDHQHTGNNKRTCCEQQRWVDG